MPDLPEQGRVVPEWLEPTGAEFIYKRHRIIYEVDPDRLELLTIRHGREHPAGPGPRLGCDALVGDPRRQQNAARWMAFPKWGETVGKIPWPRVLAEGAVIVGSILLALFLESWVAEREVRREVSADLVGIAGELEGNLSQVEFDLDLLRRTVLATGSLVETLDAFPDETHVTVADTVAGMARLVSPTASVSVGGVDALMASGRLAAVRSPALRRRLAGLSSLVADLAEDENLGRDIAWQQLNPAVVRQADLDLGYVISEVFQERVPGVPLQRRSDVSHPNNSEIRGLLRARGGWYGQAIRDAERLHVEMSELRALIRIELDELG